MVPRCPTTTATTTTTRTTIIESLKFAVCGALPPGKTAGQAFVHDPRSIGQSTVKANIKLRFTNRAGTSMVVVRSMEVQQKKTTMTFKQLDGVLRTVDQKGNRVSLSHKCSELDRQIPLLLGVSAAILEHVVFCHQEDASWPLQEGAVLKKRFDEIFDSSRYSKALEVLQRNKKEYNGKVKDLKTDLAGLSSHKHAAKGFQTEVQKYTALLEKLEDEMDGTSKQLQENTAQQERLQAIIGEVDRISDDIETARNEWTQKQAVVQKQRHMLQDDLTTDHTVRQLHELLRDFDEEIDKQMDRQKELQSEVSNRTKNVDKLRLQEKDLQSRRGRLEAGQEAQLERLKARYDRMVQIGQLYGLGDVLSQLTLSQQQQQQQQASQSTSQEASYRASHSILTDRSMLLDASHQQDEPGAPILNIPPEDMAEFYRVLSKKEAELKEALASYRDKRQQHEDELQAHLTDLLGRQKAIESERAKVAKQQNDARKELTQITSQQSSLMSASRTRKSDLDELKKRSEELLKDLEGISNDPKRAEIPIEIKSLEGKIDALARDIEDDKAALRNLRQFTEAEQSVIVLKEQCTKELEQLQESINEQSYLFPRFNISLSGVLPGRDGDDTTGDGLNQTVEGIRDEILERFETREQELRSATDEVARLQRKVSELSALVSHDQKSLGLKKGRMNELENGGILRVRTVVEQVKEYETTNLGQAEPNIDESQPQELLSFLGDRLEQADNESTEDIQPATIKKVFARLKKHVVSAGRLDKKAR
jgi:DNA repair protein RAD50